MPHLPPLPKPEEQAAIRAFWDIYAPHEERVSREIRAFASTLPDLAPIVRSMTDVQVAADEAASRVVLTRAVAEGDWVPYIERTRTLGTQYAYAGVNFSSWYELTTAFRDAIVGVIEASATDRAHLAQALRGLNRYVDLALAVLGEAYLEAKEGIIAKQQTAIRELSTPVLQLRDRLLILPVVGMVDSERARQVTEALLHAIRERRARVVVMDITGVPIVDSKVANHLVQTVEAARLMGAHVIVTGISQEIAQTMVTIGADLGHVQTLGDLQSGFEDATAILGLTLVPIAEVGK